jgi:hypothetical protein
VLYGAGVPVPISVDTASDSSYFKFNLDSINLYNDLSAEFDFRTFARTCCTPYQQRETGCDSQRLNLRRRAP